MLKGKILAVCGGIGALVSFLQSGEITEHLKIKFLGELMVSPDARFVAYQKGYRVFVNAIPSLWHQAVDEGGKLPHFELSKDGGDWPNWQGAGTVTYQLGATFFSQSLDEALLAVQHALAELVVVLGLVLVELLDSLLWF